MPIADKYKRDKRLETAISLATSSWLRCTTRLRVSERGPGDQPKVSAYKDDIDVLIRLSDGLRLFKPKADAPQSVRDWWERKAEGVRQHVVYIDCHQKQVAALLERDAKTTALLGGNRAGKSHFLAWWLFRQWLIRGFRGALFWWISPTMQMAQTGLEKLVTGEDAEGGVFPAEFVQSFPSKPISGNQTIRLIDGSRIDLHHANADGNNLKGKKVQALVIDEITSIKKVANWTIARARTLETGGPVAVGSTPMSGHWAREKIILKHLGNPEILYVEVDCWINPWVPVDEIWRLLAEDAGLKPETVARIRALPFEEQARAVEEVTTDPLILREYFGKWTADSLAAYASFRAERYENGGHIVTGDGRCAADFGFKSVTKDALLADYQWEDDELVKGQVLVGGQDFNIDPMSSVVCDVIEMPDGRWGLLALDVVQTKGTVDQHGLRLLREYPGLPLACDSSGVNRGAHPSQGSTGTETHQLHLRDLGFPAVPTWTPNGKPLNPEQVQSLLQVNLLFKHGRILVHERCVPLVSGLQTVSVTAEGKIDKKSGTKSPTDRATSAPDALRYLAWRLFGREFREHQASKRQDAYHDLDAEAA